MSEVANETKEKTGVITGLKDMLEQGINAIKDIKEAEEGSKGDRGAVTKESYGYVLKNPNAGLTPEQVEAINHIPSKEASLYKASLLEMYAKHYDYFDSSKNVDGSVRAATDSYKSAYDNVVYMTKMQDPAYLNYLAGSGKLQTEMEAYDSFMAEHSHIKEGVYNMTDSEYDAFIAGGGSIDTVKAECNQAYTDAVSDANTYFAEDYSPATTPAVENETAAPSASDSSNPDLSEEEKSYAALGLKHDENGHLVPMKEYSAEELAAIKTAYENMENASPTTIPELNIYKDNLLFTQMKDPGYLAYVASQGEGKLDEFVDGFMNRMSENAVGGADGYAYSLTDKVLPGSSAKSISEANQKIDEVEVLFNQAKDTYLADRKVELEKTKEERLQEAGYDVSAEGSDKTDNKENESSGTNYFEKMKAGAAVLLSGIKNVVMKIPGVSFVVDKVKEFYQEKIRTLYTKAKDEKEAETSATTAFENAVDGATTETNPAPEAEGTEASTTANTNDRAQQAENELGTGNMSSTGAEMQAGE